MPVPLVGLRHRVPCVKITRQRERFLQHRAQPQVKRGRGKRVVKRLRAQDTVLHSAVRGGYDIAFQIQVVNILLQRVRLFKILAHRCRSKYVEHTLALAHKKADVLIAARNFLSGLRPKRLRAYQPDLFKGGVHVQFVSGTEKMFAFQTGRGI